MAQPNAHKVVRSTHVGAHLDKRACSEKAGTDSSKLKEILEEVATMHKTPEGATAAAEAAEQAAHEGGIGAKVIQYCPSPLGSAAHGPCPPSTHRHAPHQIGNALTLGGLTASAYFGYYTLKYTTDEMDKYLDELSQETGPATKASGSAVLLSADMPLA